MSVSAYQQVGTEKGMPTPAAYFSRHDPLRTRGSYPSGFTASHISAGHFRQKHQEPQASEGQAA